VWKCRLAGCASPPVRTPRRRARLLGASRPTRPGRNPFRAGEIAGAELGSSGGPVAGRRDAGAAKHVPYVLDENLVHLQGGAGFPVDEIAKRLARALGEEATPLAAHLPVLREAVCAELIRKFSRQNGFLGVVVFVPGADLPVLTANQVRLVLRIADAHGFEIDRERLPEVLAVVASGFGFRALARKAIAYVPFVGWVVKGAVAYTATRALGEAAVRHFERRAPVTRVAGERVRF